LRRFAPDYDNTQTFADLKRVQALLKRLNRANTIIMKLDDPQRAHAVADEVEHRYGYKSVSWQEANEDLMSTLTTRNIIMYTVVSAVLVVAAFGIYNVISTVVLEKQRDIAILKSMGFRARDIRRTFLVQGVLLGLAGSALGLPFGAGLMLGLMQIRLKFPGSSDPVPLPIDWNWPQFAIAAASLWVLPSAPACCRRARRRVTETVIETEKLTRRLAGEVTVTLVEDATLAVHQGEFVAITGASGSGKSSLLYLLGLLDRPTSGQMWLRGDENSNLDEDALAGLPASDGSRVRLPVFTFCCQSSLL